jgi:pilus assembly protein CpaB
MVVRSDHSKWRNLWRSGFVVMLFVAILSVSHKMLGPRIDTGEVNASMYIVAMDDILPGVKIMPTHLALAPIPNAHPPQGVFRKGEEVVGRVAITSIGAGEPVTALKLAPQGLGTGLSGLIPEGYRAMTVKVDKLVGMSGFISPGSFVDVLAIIEPTPSQNGSHGDSISKVVLQHISVLASATKIDSAENQRKHVVTLQVTPAQAEKLIVVANSQAKLKLLIN